VKHALCLSLLFSAGAALPAVAQHQHNPEPPTVAAPQLEQQIEALRAATAKYRDIAVARAEGFVRFGKVEGPLMGEHWYRKDLVDRPLDLTRPSTLQYAVIAGERVLIGVAYTLYQHPDEPLPDGFAGSSDHWHVHDITKIARAAAEERPVLRWLVDRRIRTGRIGVGAGRTHLVMVHAWPWLDNPAGMFAGEHRVLPYLRAGLPASFADGADVDAAWGTALLQDQGCAADVQRIDFLARLSRTQKGALERACSDAAASVRAAPRAAAKEFNAAAGAAWRSYAKVKDATLTAEQRARIASVVEHPMM
jgi:hypothetical protein